MATEKDSLSSLQGLQACPSCACLIKGNSTSCPECGVFLSKEILEYEPEIHERSVQKNTPKKILDPTHYSLNPSAKIPQEDVDEEEIEDMTKEWSGGTSNFTFEEE